jgi:hypothetical protein
LSARYVSYHTKVLGDGSPKSNRFFPGLHLTKDQGSALFLDCFHDPGVAMASIRDPNSAGKVGIWVAIGILDINTFRTLRLDLGQMSPDWGEVFYGFSH